METNQYFTDDEPFEGAEEQPASQAEAENESSQERLSERMRILRMIEEGKISTQQGAELLEALGRKRKSAPQMGEQPAHTPHWFRVHVTDTVTGRARARVSIPLGLMDWGLKIGAQFAPEVAGVDLKELGQVLRSGVDGKIIDVIDEIDGEHVEIFVE
jgi:hypothetical protein